MADAVGGNGGAQALLQMVLQVRLNKRSRRSMASVISVASHRRKPRWFTVLSQHLFGLYRVFLNQPSDCNSQRTLCAFSLLHALAPAFF